MNPDESQIREVHLTWINAVNEGDLGRLLTLITDDVVFLNPGKDPLDRDGFCANFTPGPQRKALIHCVSDLEEVVVSGDVAYTRSRDSLSVTPHGGAETAKFAGYRISVYRKQPDGRWLMARDAHTLSRIERANG
jgi:uncharacterized protein (TIGR02246 family)